MGLLDGIKNGLEQIKQKSEEKMTAAREKRIKEQLQIEQFSRGENLPVISLPNNASIILQKNEVCHYFTLAYRNESKEEIIGHTGGYGGVSVRVAKGVTLHSGGVQSQPIKQNVSHSYKGILYITNKRVVFVGLEGSNKNFNIPYNKLISAIKYKDGVSFQLENKSYAITMEFSKGFNAILDGAIKVYNQ